MNNEHPWVCRICRVALSEPTDPKALAEWRWKWHFRKQHWPSYPRIKEQAAAVGTAQANAAQMSPDRPSKEPSSISCPYCNLLLQMEDLEKHVWRLHGQTVVQVKDFALSKQRLPNILPGPPVALPSDLSNDSAKVPCPECDLNFTNKSSRFTSRGAPRRGTMASPFQSPRAN